MADPTSPANIRLPLLAGNLHSCSYQADHVARMLFLHPEIPVAVSLQQSLADRGFRRSGRYFYRPWCPGCRACISIRVPVEAFQANRRQRRCWAKYRPSISITEKPPTLTAGQYELYRRYTAARHPDGSMANAGMGSCLEFFTCPWTDTRFLELRRGGDLLAVAVTDWLPAGLSAVYTFFAPEYARMSPGTLAILCQIDQARRLGLQWLYLGYWIDECRKMQYKADFRPVEAWMSGAWVRYGPGEPLGYA
jgi:arginyl-tRNA--protein-N-Asp/Glu arginylyltransferase